MIQSCLRCPMLHVKNPWLQSQERHHSTVHCALASLNLALWAKTQCTFLWQLCVHVALCCFQWLCIHTSVYMILQLTLLLFASLCYLFWSIGPGKMCIAWSSNWASAVQFSSLVASWKGCLVLCLQALRILQTRFRPCLTSESFPDSDQDSTRSCETSNPGTGLYKSL